MNPFSSLRDYQEFVYTLQQNYPAIKVSNLVVAPQGHFDARTTGELTFEHGYRLTIRELLIIENDAVRIYKYGYTFWQGNTKLARYDSQPHPNDPKLVSTHPHHKHIPPDIKHNRIPAPHIGFDSPNLPMLIEEVEGLVRLES